MNVTKKTRTDTNFRQIVKYVLKEKEVFKGKDGKELTWKIFHNISHPTIETSISEFHKNDSYRRKIKNGVTVYHEMLNFHPKDTPVITMDMLYDIAREWIRIRSPHSLVVAKPEIKGHVHIHFAFHGTELNDSKNLRMNNKVWDKNRYDIEAYQAKHYPELQHSFCYMNKPRFKKMDAAKRDRCSRQRNEYALVKKNKEKVLKTKITSRQLNKEKAHNILVRCLDKSNDTKSFHDQIIKAGLQLYYYRNKITGIYYQNKKYRFNTLGIDQEHHITLNKQLEQLREIQKTKIQYNDLFRSR